MSESSPQQVLNQRILIVDDNAAIHEDIRKILGGTSEDKASLKAAEAALFEGPEQAAPAGPQFQIHSAYRGETALEMVRQSLADDQPYAMAFVDMRMPPGWDGLETITRLWEVNPELQIVICTAYSDHSWTDIVQRLRPEDDLLVLRKPFDVIEIRQFAHALCAKWTNRRKVLGQIREAEAGLADSHHKELMREQATDVAAEKAAGPMESTREDLQSAQTMVDRLFALLEVQHRALCDMADRNQDQVPPELATELQALQELRIGVRTVLSRIFRNTMAVKAAVRSVREIAHQKASPGDASGSPAAKGHTPSP
jgi:CheY-like chemotaxis protein